MIENKPEHHWIENPEEGVYANPDDYLGFLYCIVNTAEGKLYIGKKQYWSIRKVKKAGRKNRVTRKTNNKWEYYTGSSEELNADINRLGKDKFIFILLENVETKGGLHYGEIQLQVEMDVLTAKREDGTKLYYNKHIAATKFIPRESLSKETREKLSKACIKRNEMYGNPAKLGKDHWLYGSSHSEEVKQKISRSRKGKTAGPSNPNADDTKYHLIHSDGTKEYSTKFEMRTKYQLNSSHLSAVINGKRKTHKGWRMNQEKAIDK